MEYVPSVGEIFAGKFKIEGLLGEGGMGTVLEATHLLLKQRVAIKFLQPALAQHQELLTRFVGEARKASTIRSEHVARVLDIAVLQDGVPYIVMEFLPGVDLEGLLLMRTNIPVEEVIDYILQACEAVAEAHKLGIVHRDLKPANLFLTTRADGSPLIKVFDFGISKSLRSRRSRLGANTADSDLELTATKTITATGAMMGTPLYMSPEQFLDSKHVDERTDVWALGAILYYLFSGKPPFEGENAVTVLARMATKPPPPLRAIRQDVPEALEAVILRCLQREADARIATVGELAEALEPFASASSKLSVQRILGVLGSEPKSITRTVVPVDVQAALADTVTAMGASRGRWDRLLRVGLPACLLGIVVGAGGALSLSHRAAARAVVPLSAVSPLSDSEAVSSADMRWGETPPKPVLKAPSASAAAASSPLHVRSATPGLTASAPMGTPMRLVASTPAPTPMLTASTPRVSPIEFDIDKANAALTKASASAARCKRQDDPSGEAVVEVTFVPSGRVTSTRVMGEPFHGTSTGGCIARAFRLASVPPFEGKPVTLKARVAIR